MPPVDVDARVISNRRLSSDYSVLTLEAPAVGASSLPGQFVMIRSGQGTDPLLRRPFSIFEVLRGADGTPIAISILNKIAGRSTRALYDLETGDRIQVLGPLGRPFSVASPPQEAWMVAGGVGLAPFATLAGVLARAGAKATLFYGARTAGDLFCLDLFDGLRTEIVLATEDGSRGARGRVTVPLETALAALPPSRRVLVQACGPEPMLEAVAGLAARYGQPSEVSVERVMGCGLGGCYSCVVSVRQDDGRARFVRSCVAGPVFSGADLVWG